MNIILTSKTRIDEMELALQQLPLQEKVPVCNGILFNNGATDLSLLNKFQKKKHMYYNGYVVAYLICNE